MRPRRANMKKSFTKKVKYKIRIGESSHMGRLIRMTSTSMGLRRMEMGGICLILI